MIEVYHQDKKVFIVHVETNSKYLRYSKGWKYGVETGRLLNEGTKFSAKVMVSAAITWKGISG